MNELRYLDDLAQMNTRITKLEKQNADLLYALEATHSVIEDLSDTGNLDREGTLAFLAEAIRKTKEE